MARDSNDLFRENVVKIVGWIVAIHVVVPSEIAASQMKYRQFVEIEHKMYMMRLPIREEWVDELGLATCVLANSYQPRAKQWLLFLLLLWWFDEEDILFGEVTEWRVVFNVVGVRRQRGMVI
jgi:hypothetical protein